MVAAITALVPPIIKVVFGALSEAVGVSARLRQRLGQDPEKQAFQYALTQALTDSASHFPGCDPRYFAEILREIGGPVLARTLQPAATLPTADELTTVWLNHLTVDSLIYYRTEFEQVAGHFLDRFNFHLENQQPLQWVVQARRRRISEKATQRVAEAAERSTADSRALREGVVRSTTAQTGSGSTIKTAGGAYIGANVSAQHFAGRDLTIKNYFVAGLPRLVIDYSSRIQEFLLEYLGSNRKRVPFGGRGQQLAELHAWLDDPAAPPYYLMSAEAGRGKSELVCRWLTQLTTRPDLGLIFVPISIRFETATQDVVFATLAARLANLYESEPEKLPLASLTAEQWKGVCQSYLRRTPPEGRKLVVILDGLDEATGWTPGQGLFSADPPDGLRVLVTARTGPGDIAIGGWATTLGWANPQLAIITTLSGLDRRGVEDALVSVGNPLDKLATKVDVVGELHRLSEGDPLLVRLYVDALVAQPQRLAALSAEDMHTIQPGLKGYIERWWQDQREQWRIEGRNPITEQGHLRLLLNAIAASLGPLTLDDLAALHSDLTDSTLLHELLEHVRRWLVGDGKQQGYSYTHPRLGYFFWEQLSSHEQRAWNERFVGWGTRILTDLNSGALPSNFAPRYLLQNYAAHLRRAQAPPAQFYALISDGWRKARGELDITDGRFLNDVERAWEQAKQSYNLTTSGKGVALIQQVKAMLCQASRIALGSNLQPRLLAQMVQFGLYTPTQALAIAKLAPTEIERSHQLQALAPFLSEVFLSEALAAARSIRDEVHRASALCHLAPHLPAASLGEALMAATSFSDEGYRAEVLRSLAPHLSEALLNEGLAVARSIQNKDYRARALSSLAPHLSAELLSEALAGARSIRDGNYRTKALSDLAPHLSPNLLSKALTAARSIRDENYRAEALSDLAPHLSPKLLSKALTAARSIRDENYRAEALSKLAPCLPETFRLEVLGEALRAVRSIEKNYGDGDLHICRLRNLALHLPETTRLEVLAEALTIARSIQNEEHRVRALSILVLHLPETRRMEVLNEALTVARSVRYELDRAEAFGNLAPHLPETLRLEVLNEALKAARSLPNRMDFTWVLSSLVPHLPQTLRMEVLGEALTVARSIQDNDHRTIALSSLASHLPVGLLSEIWTMARSIQGGDYRVEALRNLAPRLTKGQLSEALIAATSIRDERCRAEALSSLAPHLPEALFSEGLIAATSIRDDMYRAEALTSLAPHLPQALLSEALIAARSMRGDYRTEVLSSLAPYLSEALRKKVLDEALAVARVGYTEEQRAYALSCLAPHLPEALPKEVLGEILTAVRSSRQGMDRFHALNRLAPHCPHTVRLEVVSEALTAIYAIQGSDYSDFDALGSLLPLLPEMLRREALDEALTRIRSFRLPGSHARALSSLASHLPITWLGELLTAAGSIENDYHNLHWRDLALRNLVKPLIACILQSPELVYSSFVETLPVLASRPRPEFLRDITFLMPVILALAGDEAPQAAEGIYHAVQEVCGWWP